LGAPSNFGTTPGAVAVPGVNSSMFIGTTVAVAASAGVQKVGISGATGTTMDVVIGGATAAANALQIAGVFNTTQPTFTTGQGGALQMDNRGNLLVNTLAGSTIASAVGTSAMQTGINVGGTLRLWTGVNPSGTVYAGQTDLTSVAGTTVVTAAAGVQKVGVVGNAGAIFDTTIGAGTAAANAIQIAGVYQTTVPALTNGQSVATQLDTTGALFTRSDSRVPTYHASASITPIAATAQPLWIISGSATKTIRITGVRVVLISTTGVAAPVLVTLNKLSSLTGGTAAAVTKTPLDSGFAAATATVNTYAGGLPTASTIVGAVSHRYMQWITASATADDVSEEEWDFGSNNDSQIILRGTGQYLSLLLGSIGTTPSMIITVEWLEDNS